MAERFDWPELRRLVQIDGYWCVLCVMGHACTGSHLWFDVSVRIIVAARVGALAVYVTKTGTSVRLCSY
jgi:hypothetical protein